ncbi:MAG: Phosphomethylpyrimidine kinase type-2 [Frankiales bacterium]|nr:Phosphomethylpyrimidine kinase type-2 [Frankiales bacterium]
MSACGVFGTTVIVALTAQNTVGVTAIHECPPEFIRAQLAALFADLRPQAIKSGMLFSATVIHTVADFLDEFAASQPGHPLPFVLDPVMVASSGARLLAEDAVAALVERLFPLATVITPNLMEAQALTGLATEDRIVLTEALVRLGARAALVTGGHGLEPVEHLFHDGRHLDLPVIRHDVAATHGAGCTHSAALAACLARGDSLEHAARRAVLVAGAAVKHGLAGLGAGDGPVDALNLRTLSPPDPPILA